MSVTREGSELVIRPIEPRDAPEVSVLIEQLGYRREQSEVARWIRALPLHREQQTAFVACLDNEVVGWIEVSIEHRLQSPPFAMIGGLVVKDGYRNRQIGLRLCEKVEAWSWAHGLSTLRVTSRSTRADAHRFYLQNGYTQTKLSHVFEKKRPS